MLVGFVLKSDPTNINIVDINTKDHIEAIDVTKEAYSSRVIVRCLAVVEGGKSSIKEVA